MSDEVLSVPDMLADVIADIDTAQAMINEARTILPYDLIYQKLLDEKQFELDLKRERVKIVKHIASIVYSE